MSDERDERISLLEYMLDVKTRELEIVKNLYRRVVADAILAAILSWIVGVIVATVSLSSATGAKGAEPNPPPPDVKPELHPTTFDATGWALSDSVTVPADRRPFQRYLWIPPWGSDKWVAAANYVVNTVIPHPQDDSSRSITLGTVIANGWMVRYDLSELQSDSARLSKTIEVWDGLARKDPYFHVPDANTKLGVAVIASQLDPTQAALLNENTLSAGAVYRMDWFFRMALSTLNNGVYYDFRQVIRKPEKGTPLDWWLSERSLFVLTSQKGGGESRAAMFRSGVTGKPRRIDVFPTLSGGVGSITRDLFDGNVKAESHPIRNLINFQDDGSEVIVAMANGLHDYVLANAKGEIVDVAPPDLVRDSTIPAPHTAQLQPAISCISCHEVGKDDGWKKTRNDVITILGSKLDIFGDFSELGLTPQQGIIKLRGLYAARDLEHPDGPLQRGRRDHAAAVFKCTAGIPFDPERPICEQVGQLVTSIVHSYEYDLITPTVAARELGVTLPPDVNVNPLELTLLEPGPNNSIDPIEGFLRIGISVNRTDFETVYADLATSSEHRRGRKK